MSKCKVGTVLKVASILCAICALVIGALEIMIALLPYLVPYLENLSMTGSDGRTTVFLGVARLDGTITPLIEGIVFAALAGVFALLAERYHKEEA